MCMFSNTGQSFGTINYTEKISLDEHLILLTV